MEDPTSSHSATTSEYAVVRVKAEYLFPTSASGCKKEDPANAKMLEVAQVVEINQESNEGTVDIPSNEDIKSKSTTEKGGRNKKRPRDTRPPPENRLCLTILRGQECSFGSTCQYSHDPIDFLSKKPPDIGPICFHYESFGWCPSGIACRYGDSHIDRIKGISLTRSVEDGGVKDKVNINMLNKPLQITLRKKAYDFSVMKRSQPVTISRPNRSDIQPVDDDDDDDGDISAPSVNMTPYDTPVKLVDFSDKVYVAPLTTVGNLPFRRILKDFGADITCGEMAMTDNLQQGQASEWALLRRHSSENMFGIQIACGHVDQMNRIAKILQNETSSDFVDLNCGCPIDLVCNKGCGSGLLTKQNRLLELVASMSKNLYRSITVKMRTGMDEKNPFAHKLVPELQKIGQNRLAAIMIHGRSRHQRYHRLANWEYVLQAAQNQDPNLRRIPIIGNGDILSWEDWQSRQGLIRAQTEDPDEIRLCSCAMIGRGALIKPWIPQEIKESRSVDISASERLDMLKTFCNYGLEHWGSDDQGKETTRRFLLEWLSFLHRYVPVGLVDSTQKMNQRPPHYFGRCDMETLMASANSKDWIRISELILGPVSDRFNFIPKHKSNAYAPEAESISNG